MFPVFLEGWTYALSSECQTIWNIEFITGLPGLFSLGILGEMENFGVFGLTDFSPSAIFLESRFSFLNLSIGLLTKLLCVYIYMYIDIAIYP